MRPTREQAKENRQRILDAAGRLFRENGIHSVGVDAVMKGAGLTHGGFYGHFKSKGDLTAEAMSNVMRQAFEQEPEYTSLEDFASVYLSGEHRDGAGVGCVMAALAPEIARLPEGERGSISDYIRKRITQIEHLQAASGGKPDRARAIADLSSLVGALVMARAVDDKELSDEILAQTRAALANGGA
ncbi:TetR/AcrR family transcriptional regulator [Rhizobiaceae bacterium n13]|uniref:TetR/AcrR family transcriptional regulator n=1 Tax=Ferirhizobium litorale TaxID=2927786 RepID=A0AAE3U419_9HYPH|nr:TetR family transcriptional regulator [Fererhizobium litorale]MDI7862168.1 TetR/AcrR family transcriptional regulator [Fererhizobium litorale]MDI7922559.1 TetR/AcrR family transcriptional regulator [Fererhizobium litorale]